MKPNLNKITKNFILNEGQLPAIDSWIQALAENISALKPKALYEKRRVEVMKQQLSELRREARRMNSRIGVLEEELKVLRENKSNE
jgi:chromosome segregation ATPase